jgi:hypothetical protein
MPDGLAFRPFASGLGAGRRSGWKGAVRARACALFQRLVRLENVPARLAGKGYEGLGQ